MTTVPTTKKQRSCVACAAKDAKGSLLRIVRTPEGDVRFDATGRASGRGAYVCSAECLAKACKTGRLERALKVRLGQADYERIASDLQQALGVAER